MKPQKIGKLNFKSLKACTNYARNIINGLNGEIHKTHEHFEFILDLLNNHPQKDDKIGVGIDYFLITFNLYQEGKNIYIMRLDGSIIDFSWIYCCGNKKGPLFDLTNAMRNIIKPYTKSFKQNNILKCNICQCENLEYYKYTVDHKSIPFSKLMEDFIKINNHDHLIFDDCPETNSAIFKQNEMFSLNWVEYHNQYADYQILCNKCNSKKGAKINH